MNTHNTSSDQHSRTTINGAAAALWASAIVVIALIIVQAGRLPGNQALAAVAAARGPYHLLTASSGQGPETNPDDVLFVIDDREQILLVYEIENVQKKQITLRDGGNLEGLFQRARQ